MSIKIYNKEFTCKYCKKLHWGGIYTKVCFDCRSKRNRIRARKRARRIRKAVNKT